MVNEFLEEPCPHEFAPVTVHELKTHFRRTRNNKAPGLDRITNFVLKKLPRRALGHLAKVYNACIRLGYFPQNWKTALILVFPKAGKDLTRAASYRPISLLSTLSKALEVMILNRLKPIIRDRKLIRDDQFGFRDQHSTQHQVIRLTEYITRNYNWKQNTGAVLLDVEKAFDSVWTNGLLRKLLEMEIPKGLIHILASYLNDRSFRVKVDDVISEPRPIRAGVPQGSILGPVLFTLYINDMPTPEYPNLEMGIYADDTIIYGTSRSNPLLVKRLNGALENIREWCLKWRVKINAAKSEAILFSKKQEQTKDLQPPSLNDVEIPWKDQLKYLGIILDKALNYNSHTTSAKNKAIGIMSKLMPLLRNHSALGIKNGILIHKTFIRPVLTYASAVWGGTSKTNLDKIQIIQNKVLRLVTGAPIFTKNSLIHRELEIETTEEFIARLARKFYEKASNSDYDVIKSLGDYEYDKRDKYRRPKDFLDMLDG